MRRIFRWRPAGLGVLLLTTAAASPGAPRVEAGGLLFDNVPAASPGVISGVDAYLAARQATVLGWSPQGQLLIATRFGETPQLHLVANAGGERRQVTFLREPVRGASFSPDPSRAAFLYLADEGGSEKSQLFYQRLGEPAARLLSDGKSINAAAVWSNTGRAIAFSSNARDPGSLDIDLIEPEAGTLPRLLVAGEGAAWHALDWSPDDSRLLAVKRVSAAESHLFLIDIDTGKKRELDAGAAPASILDARVARDGQGAYLISDRDSEWRQLRFVNFFTGQLSVLSAHIPADIGALALSRDGHYLAFVSNEGGADKLNLLDLTAHQDLTPPRLPQAGLIGSLHFDADSKRLAFGFGAATLPEDAYVLDVAGNQLEAWTHSETGAADAAKFVNPRLVRFPSFDRDGAHLREIPAYVYEPAGAGVRPVVILLRGDVHEQFRPGFDPWIQYLVNELGYAVVAPNLRGSSGYGKSYASLNAGRLREDAVKDLGALLVWLHGQDTLDAYRVAVLGERYGGYLALSALINYGDRLRGAVEAGGIADFVAMLNDSTALRQEALRREFGDERDPDVRAYLRRISPLTYPERIAKPLLILQGKNAADGSAPQAERLLNLLRSRGADVDYLQADEEGREFTKQRDREAYFSVLAAFLAALRDPGPAQREASPLQPTAPQEPAPPQPPAPQEAASPQPPPR